MHKRGPHAPPALETDSQENPMSYGRFLAKGAGEGTPPFRIVAVALAAVAAVAFLVSGVRKKQHPSAGLCHLVVGSGRASV